MNTMFKRLFVGALAIGCLCMPSMARAADENDIIQLEKQLIQKETEMLEPELKLDKLLVERAKLDGMGGWFQGSKKKEIERQMGEANTLINRLFGEMSSLQNQVQQMVFAVAYEYEKKGDFKKAIEYYLKVERQDDKVLYRLATCHKALKDYEQAIQWLLKMSRTDQNLLEVVDCYQLDGRMKEAFYWLFQIVEPIDGNPAELTALKLLETYDYAGKKSDYPNFIQRLSDVYLQKAVREYNQNPTAARDDYRKAVELIAQGGDPKAASLDIVTRYQNAYRGALDILEQQKIAAERNYEDMLRDAKGRYDEAENRYRRAQREAEDQYRFQLENQRRDLERAEWELARLQKEASPSAELIDQARRKLQDSRDRYQYINTHKFDIIENQIAPYRREVKEAMDRYEQIVRDRTMIIERYIAPYRQQAEAARQAFELMRNLHETVYGLH